MIEVIVPQVGQDIATAVILAWRKNINDPVQKGEIIAEVESDKAVFEIEAEESGVLLEILHEEGTEVEVFKPIGRIGQPGEQIARKKSTAAASASPSIAASAVKTVSPKSAPSSGRIAVSPIARSLAAKHDIDLDTVEGSGPGGRIVRSDVEAVIARGSADAGKTQGDREVLFTRVRRRIAQRLTASKQTIPHFYLFIDVDMSNAIARRNEIAAAPEDSRVTYTDLVIKAVSHSLVQFPHFNAHVFDDRLVLKAQVNIGVAVAVEEGLLVPVIPNASSRSLNEIAKFSRENAEKARQGTLSAESPATFTVTSLGMHGIPRFLPVINPPECAILGIGAIEKRVIPVGEGMAVRSMMTLTLAADHRAIDGVDAARFLNDLKDRLEHSEFT